MEIPREAAWTIVLENLGLVYKVVNRHARRDQDKKDLEQEGRIALFEAARRYDESKAAFSTFAYSYIQGAVLNWYNRRSDSKDDQLTAEAEENLLDEHEQDYVRDALKKQLLVKVRLLPDQERAIILLRWLIPRTLSHREIAAHIGVSHSQILKLEQRAFQKLRALMEKEVR
jgi:DNA-directed RNA polymerase